MYLKSGASQAKKGASFLLLALSSKTTEITLLQDHCSLRWARFPT